MLCNRKIRIFEKQFSVGIANADFNWNFFKLIFSQFFDEHLYNRVQKNRYFDEMGYFPKLKKT